MVESDPAAWFQYGGMNVYETPEGQHLLASAMIEQQPDLIATLTLPDDWDGSREDWVKFGRPNDLPKDYDLLLVEQIPDAHDEWEGNNTLGWCDEEAARTLTAGEETLVDNERLPYYLTFQRIFMEQVPSIPLFQRIDTDIMDARLCGPEHGPLQYPTWNIHEWYIDTTGEGCQQ